MSKKTITPVVEKKLIITKPEMLKYIEKQLERNVERYDKQRLEFIAKISPHDCDMMNTIAWSGELIVSGFIARASSQALAWHENYSSMISAIRVIHSRSREMLLRDELRGDSTGQMHRAVENLQRAATVRIVEDFTRMLNEYDKAEA